MNLPNLISIFRLFLILPILYFFLKGQCAVAFWLFVVANISDFLDGFLARLYNQTTQFGRYIDPIADKILIMSVYIVITFSGLVPWWVVAIIVIRDVLIFIGSYILFSRDFKLSIKPTFISKVNTVIQMFFVSCK